MMTEMAENNDLPSMLKLYHQKAVPMSDAFKEGLQKISEQLRSKYNLKLTK